MFNLKKIAEDYDVICFDLDDTIFNYSHAHNTAIEKVLIEFGLTFGDYNKAKQEIKKRKLSSNHHKKELYFKVMCEEKGLKISAVLEMYELYERVFNENLYADKSMMDFIISLKKDEKTVIAITNYYVIPQIIKLTSTCFIDHIDYLITSEEFEIEKPNKKLFNKAMELANNPDTSRVMMFGDSVVDDMSSFGVYYHPYNCSKLLIGLSGNTDTHIFSSIIRDVLTAEIINPPSNNLIKQGLDIKKIYQNVSSDIDYSSLDVIIFEGKYTLYNEVTGEYVKIKIHVNDTAIKENNLIDVQKEYANILINMNNDSFKIIITDDFNINVDTITGNINDLESEFKNLINTLKENRYIRTA